VKVEVGVEEASVDLVLTVEYGKPIQKVCVEVQESVRKAIETMTGLHVVKVDVHVVGVSFERETKEIAQGYVKATTAQKAIEEMKTPAVPPFKERKEELVEESDSLVDGLDQADEEPDEPKCGNLFEDEESFAKDDEADESLEEWPE
jgi:hypothetical protein